MTESVKQADLEQIKLVAVKYITQELAEQFAIAPKVALSTHGSFVLDDLVLRVVQRVYGRVMERIEARYPADWREAFKERWYPVWAKARWPVRWTEVQLVARELYPKMAMPWRSPQLALDLTESTDGHSRRFWRRDDGPRSLD